MARITARDAARLAKLGSARVTPTPRSGQPAAKSGKTAAPADQRKAAQASSGSPVKKPRRATKRPARSTPLRMISATRTGDNTVTLDFTGRLQPKERARNRGDGRGMFTPTPTREAHTFLKNIGSIAMRGAAPLEGPVMAEIVFWLTPPKDWSQRRKEAAYAGKILPDVKPDSDNVLKTLYDGLNKIVYQDDAQICMKVVLKMYGTTDRVRATFRPMRALSAKQPLPV